jgi:hypothetical protein
LISAPEPHESSHVIVGRHLGFPVALATIIPGPDYGGRVIGPGTDPGASLAEQIARTESHCAQAMSLRPGPGEPQDDYAPWECEARCRCLELLAGREGERLAAGDATLSADSDLQLANLYAGTVCAPAAIPAYLAFARQQARAILQSHWYTVLAPATALDREGTLTGETIDRIISQAEATAEHHREVARRQKMNEAIRRAAVFLKLVEPEPQGNRVKKCVTSG